MWQHFALPKLSWVWFDGNPSSQESQEATIWNFESESYVKNIFTNYVVSINKAENDICFNVLEKSSFMSFIGLKYSEADNTTVGIY